MHQGGLFGVSAPANIFVYQLKIWVIGFLISDFIFLVFVALSYLVYHGYLYRYAYIKSIFCTGLLVYNFIFMCYGAYIIANLPVEHVSDETVT